jgi:hypothetical protein
MNGQIEDDKKMSKKEKRIRERRERRRRKQRHNRLKKCKKKDRRMYHMGKEFVVTFYKTDNVKMRHIHVTIFSVEKQ